MTNPGDPPNSVPSAEPTSEDAREAAARAALPQGIRNLSDLALFIASPVTSVMQAAFVIFTAEGALHHFDDAEMRRRFRTHPASCLHFSALRALEDHSVVVIAETLDDQDGLFPHDIPIRQQADLFLHRNAISHPTVVKWRPTMKPFVAAKRPLYDWIPAMVWDLQRSINDELRKAGAPTFYDTINVTEEMGRMLHSILNFALRPEFQFPPDISPVVEKMRSNVPKFIALLEKFPDGNTGKDRSAAPGIIPA